MTETEIVKNLGKKISFVTNIIKELAELDPAIKKKYNKGVLCKNSEFTLRETKEIYRAAGANELQIELLEENWVDKKGNEVYTIKGTEDFVKKFNEDKNIKCCNTCEFLKGKSGKKIIPKPFCSVYNMYLHSFKADVYEDYCSSYKYIELPKPRLWYKDTAPINLNSYGEINTINGIERSRLNVEKKKGDPVIIVNKIGF